jgi:muramoyltetrapeptide carboxypeptidase
LSAVVTCYNEKGYGEGKRSLRNGGWVGMSKRIKPRRLKRGDTVGIVAPACFFDKDNFRRGVDKLKDLGFNVKYDLMIFKKHWSMAGYDVHRARQINRMFEDRDIKAIFCAQAGYGSMRTIPYLDKNIIRKNPKIFVGYSDITVLLSYLYKVSKMVVFHGPVVSGEMHNKMSPVTLDLLMRVLMKTGPLGDLSFPAMKSLRPGKATGELVGGNMSLLMALLGTPYEINTDGRILFLEDVDEDMESIDSYMMHLKLAGKFKRIRGIVFGRMKDCIDYSGEKYTIQDILNDILKDVEVPVIYGFPSGHREMGQTNVTLPLGVSVTLDADALKLEINESGVR